MTAPAARAMASADLPPLPAQAAARLATLARALADAWDADALAPVAGASGLLGIERAFMAAGYLAEFAFVLAADALARAEAHTGAALTMADSRGRPPEAALAAAATAEGHALAALAHGARYAAGLARLAALAVSPSAGMASAARPAPKVTP